MILKKNLRGKTISLDADGTLIDFDYSYCEQASNIIGREVLKVCDNPELLHRFNVTLCESSYIFDRLNFSTFKPYDYAAELIEELKFLAPVNCITDTNVKHYTDRCSSLSNIGIDRNNIFCVGVGNSKTLALKNNNSMALLDDGIGNILKAKRENILFPILLNRNYSSYPNIESDVIVVDHPFDYIEMLKNFVLYK
jgi:hypothetical protein